MAWFCGRRAARCVFGLTIQQPLTRGHTRWALSLGGLIGVVLLVHGAAWWIIGGRLIDGIHAFTATAASEGWRIDSGTPERSGWPWAATVRLPDVVARRNLGGAVLEWAAERVLVRISPADPGAIQVVASGNQAVGFGPMQRLPLRAAASSLRVPLASAGPTTFELRDVVLGSLRAGLVNGQVAPLAFGVTASPVILAPALAPPFDKGFALTLGLVLSRPLHGAASPRDTAAAWQAEEGRVTIPSLELTWGPVHLTCSGFGGLDARLQPFGHATLNVQGGPEVLAAAARAGLLAPGPASAVRAVLGLLVLAAPGGVVNVPITLQDRTLTAAQFPLARLPPLTW